MDAYKLIAGETIPPVSEEIDGVTYYFRPLSLHARRVIMAIENSEEQAVMTICLSLANSAGALIINSPEARERVREIPEILSIKLLESIMKISGWKVEESTAEDKAKNLPSTDWPTKESTGCHGELPASSDVPNPN